MAAPSHNAWVESHDTCSLHRGWLDAIFDMCYVRSI